ncbi:MAG: MerR family transcriptional regulator [Gammaproteobacteria bacterium]|nr:MerR family transcriptional regulator [Gammaproteobacteria bacterium]
MYQISTLANLVGLSRTTLLYYEKQGLIASLRQPNGYRSYSEAMLGRLQLLQQLQAAGLSLQECKACLDAKIEKPLLQNRLQQLDAEIAEKQTARGFLAALLGEGSLREWHAEIDQLAPEAHLAWLNQQGFDEKQALHLRWLSKDMNQHDDYMRDFMRVFGALERWGPGSEEDSLKALNALPAKPRKLLEIGCGKGFSTSLLATHTDAEIIAIDNEQSALDDLAVRLAALKLDQRVRLECASMTELPFSASRFDLIWCEASAYIMGVERALTQWRPIITPGGCLVLSDLVWLTDSPSQNAIDFWRQEYADLQTVETRLSQMAAAGYQVLDNYTLSEQAWRNYYQPLKARVLALQSEIPNSTALADIAREIDIYEQYLGEFGYEMFILKRAAD